ncbi:MAG: hypothetical protein D3924_02645 [Candidatus Electrothrix sp. AR4]|nr:hypothetical protein [Candidatus Electrothrix sp. AR4]
MDLVRILAAENAALRKRIEELEAKLRQDSSNSNKPPSSDSPYDENGEPGENKKQQNPRKKRKGFRQRLMPPTATASLS